MRRRDFIRGLGVLALSCALIGEASAVCNKKPHKELKAVMQKPDTGTKKQEKESEPVQPKRGDLPPKYVLLALDITGSTRLVKEQNEQACIRIIRSLKPGDCLNIIFVTEATFSNPEQLLVIFRMPLNVGMGGTDLRRKQTQAINQFKKIMQEMPSERGSTSLVDGISLFSQILQEQDMPRKVLVLISDLREERRDFNIETISQKGSQILSQLKGDGLIPNLGNIEVYCLGIATTGLTPQKYQRLRNFWTGFWQLTGCRLISMDVGYNREID